MTPERETDQSIKEGRAVERAAARGEQEADDMQAHSEKLGRGIEEARQDWQRKRRDQSVPGANPPESEEGPPQEASFPSKERAEDGTDSGEGTPASPANP